MSARWMPFCRPSCHCSYRRPFCLKVSTPMAKSDGCGKPDKVSPPPRRSGLLTANSEIFGQNGDDAETCYPFRKESQVASAQRPAWPPQCRDTYAQGPRFKLQPTIAARIISCPHRRTHCRDSRLGPCPDNSAKHTPPVYSGSSDGGRTSWPRASFRPKHVNKISR